MERSGGRETIFILDDNVISIMTTEDVLLQNGYEVVKMSSASGLVAKLEYARPDVMLLDPTLPRLDIDATLDEIRASTELSNLAIVLYCDLEANETYEIARQHRLDGYFCKSLEVSKLPQYIDQLFDESPS
ncbi:MAG: response regulator [Myxococcales bacterium]|nr:response regulator [Myxococcales bacterium]